MTAPSRRRVLLLGVFLPVVVFETGLGAVLPIIALTAVDLGATAAGAGVVVALLAVGQILGDVPAGAVAARLGDRRAMLLAATAAIGVLTVAALATSLLVLGMSLLTMGAINAVFMLARHSYLAETTPVMQRARVLSTLGGLHRVGTFIGPFVGAGIVHLTGLRGSYWLAVGTSVATVLVIAAVPDVERTRSPAVRTSTRAVLRDHRHLLATLGLAVLMVGAVRASRQVVLPLWSEHLGLAPATTSIVFGISGAVDMLLFYPAGWLMDRRGRLWTAVPSMLVLGAGLLVLPLSTDLLTIAVVAMVIGFGNGMGAGILMTIGADVAPPGARAQFLGLWRLCQDSGGAGGPLLVAAGAAMGSLAVGTAAMGVIGIVSAGALARWVPRWSVHASAATRRRAREAGLLD